jgi:hypothetical protein
MSDARAEVIMMISWLYSSRFFGTSQTGVLRLTRAESLSLMMKPWYDVRGRDLKDARYRDENALKRYKSLQSNRGVVIPKIQ